MMTGLRATLLRTGHTQSLVASELGVSRSHVSEWCNGRREIPVTHIVAICRLLGCNPDQLIGWTDRP